MAVIAIVIVMRFLGGGATSQVAHPPADPKDTAAPTKPILPTGQRSTQDSETQLNSNKTEPHNDPFLRQTAAAFDAAQEWDSQVINPVDNSSQASGTIDKLPSEPVVTGTTQTTIAADTSADRSYSRQGLPQKAIRHSTPLCKTECQP